MLLQELQASPPRPEQIEAAKQRLLSLRLRTLQLLEQRTAYDVGILRCDQRLGSVLEASPDQELRPNMKLFLAGLPFDVEDAYFDPTLPFESPELECRIRRLQRTAKDAPARLIASGATRQHDQAYLGCPLLDQHGEVVALYSRPEPLPSKPTSGEPPATADAATASSFDAPLFARVLEVLNAD